MRSITAIIERGTDGRYSVYIENQNYPYGIIGTGSSAKDALEDFKAGYEEMKEFVEESGDSFVEADIHYKYDIPSFLQEFAFAFTLAGLERITGINQKQLGHYMSGYRKPSAKTVRRMEEGIQSFSRQLAAIQFV